MNLHDTEYVRTVVTHEELGDCTAEIAMVGRSNVGKSSLINAVCGRRKIARTSQTPGKTRTINVYETARGRWIVDLPGYGFATGPAAERDSWAGMIEGYLLNRPALRMVFMIVDAFVGPTKLDRQMLKWLQHSGLRYRVVANKADKVPAPKAAERRAEIARGLDISATELHWVSASQSDGVRELAREMVEELSS